MNIFKKGLGLAALLVGAVACSNDDVVEGVDNSKFEDTYASIQIQLPKMGGAESRAPLTEKWGGRDVVETVDVFLVNTDKQTVDFTSLEKENFEIDDKAGTLTPTKALKATAGENIKAYVVLNGGKVLADGQSDGDDPIRLTNILKSTPYNMFERRFKEHIITLASGVSKMVENGGREMILMTNAETPGSIVIESGVSKKDAIEGAGKNRIKVEVERVVARGIVTQSVNVEPLVIKDLKGENKVTISNLTYGIGGSNKAVNLIKMKDQQNTEDYWTLNYDYVVKGDNVWTEKYDYSGLKTPNPVLSIDNSDASHIIEALKKEAVSQFALPVTHAKEGYQKGNTTFFEVRATFKPERVVTAGSDDVYKEGQTLYLGEHDKQFYTHKAWKAKTEKATKDANEGQRYSRYLNSEMIYVLWLNPDEVPGANDTKKAKTSPTLRNQVYHVNINGFKELGLPYNPLNPTDPNNPDNPKDPTKPEGPDNPKDPDNPEGPDNPIDPKDPLQMDKTYLSVEVSVLNWALNSYGIDLGNDY